MKKEIIDFKINKKSSIYEYILKITFSIKFNILRFLKNKICYKIGDEICG